MASDVLSSLLKDLEGYFECPLAPDAKQTCLVRLKTGVNVQLELDRAGENLIVGIKLGEVPPGRYRESLFKAALKSNGLSSGAGIFAYSPKSNQFILFAKVPLTVANPAKLKELFDPMFAKALLWQTSVTRSETPVVSSAGEAPTGSGIFGIKR